jgi:tyrosyl-DNA phosphodiesterase-1
MDEDANLVRPRKRTKISTQDTPEERAPLFSLTTPISPPRSKSQGPTANLKYESGSVRIEFKTSTVPSVLASPFSLTAVRDLQGSLNVDAVSLKQLLGDPMIAECWQFNYLHDLDFLMGSFDEDVRALVKVHVVHGFWRQEDGAGLKVWTSYFIICQRELSSS